MEKEKEDFPSIREDDIDAAFKRLGEIDKELLSITETVDEALDGVKKIISEVDTIKLDLRR